MSTLLPMVSLVLAADHPSSKIRAPHHDQQALCELALPTSWNTSHSFYDNDLTSL